MATLDFDGADDFVQSATLGVDFTTGAFSVLAVIERDATGGFQAIIVNHDATVPRIAFEINSGNTVLFEINGASSATGTTTITDTTDTWFVAYTKASGAVLGRVHLKNLTTLAATVHESTSGTGANPLTQAGGFIKIGNYGTGNTDDYNGPIALVSEFDVDLGDAGIDTILASRSTSAVRAQGPKLLVECNRLTPVDLMGLTTFNAASGATLTGPDPTNWTLDGAVASIAAQPRRMPLGA